MTHKGLSRCAGDRLPLVGVRSKTDMPTVDDLKRRYDDLRKRAGDLRSYL